MKRVFIKNYSDFKDIMGMNDSNIYRNSVEIADALQEEVDENGIPEDGYLLIPYKVKPELMEGDCIFRFIENSPTGIYFEFETTVS